MHNRARHERNLASTTAPPTEVFRDEVYELQIEKQPLTRGNNQLRGNESNINTYSFDYSKACKNTQKTFFCKDQFSDLNKMRAYE